LGDRTNLNMVGRQDELVDAIAATGKPIVALVFGGRPLSITNLVEKSSAVFQCWYLGQETGQAVAEVLFGDVNPSGKLPITIPRSVGHLPAFYNHKPSARRGYLFDDVSPLFPFGFGLSYTEFHFSPPRLERSTIGRHESTTALIEVTNVGDRPGDAVVQLYIRDLVSSVTRPVKELKAFQRVSLAPGASRTVELPITPESLAFWNLDMEFTVEPGDFAVMTGPDSANLQTAILTVTDRPSRRS
jgi:beta-glucosidase